MAKLKRILAADLFCGAGGTSTGLLRAAELLNRRVELTAVNHWDRAIETHSANHPTANHFCQSLADLDPKRAVPGGKLDLLVASPECTHHSVARGGKPVNDQSRASAYCVHRWCAALDVKRVLIENVPEFQSWGPLGTNGKPLASKKGVLFEAFVNTMKAMGYRVEWRVLNAADYGGATTRRRLFIQAAKGKVPIYWPARTHEPAPTPGLFGETLAKWRAARGIIDWNLRGDSIFGRKRPLSENTLRRIEAGLRKFGGKNAEPFLVLLRGTDKGQIQSSAKSADEPLPPVTCSGAHVGLCEPFVMRASNGGDDNCRVKSPDEPLGTIHAGGGSFGLVEPFLIGMEHGGHVADVDAPIRTITTADAMGMCEPFIIGRGHPNANGSYVYDADSPLPTVTTCAEHGVVEPFIVPQMTSNNPRSVDDPAPTLTTTSRGVGLCEPFITPFYANGEADSVADPLRTVTTRDRFGLCEPQAAQAGTVGQVARLDILFRMLQPNELAGAMGFPAGYRITGNRSEQVRQIGNAVEVNQAAALCGAMLGEAA
jgi:DNA (cytosine-5)-methyltransferase 1